VEQLVEPGTHASQCARAAEQRPAPQSMTLSNAVWFALHFSSVLPVHRYWLAKQKAEVHAPAVTLHGAAVVQVSLCTHDLGSAAQPWRSIPEHVRSPSMQVAQSGPAPSRQ